MPKRENVVIRTAMTLNRSVLPRVLLLSVAFGIGMHAAIAQNAPTLPGGAGSLTETHGDWTVSCVIRDAGGKPAKLCAISQEQQDSKTRQRILRVELQPKGKQAEGMAILPFGLALGDGVKLQIDDGEPGAGASVQHMFAGGLPDADRFRPGNAEEPVPSGAIEIQRQAGRSRGCAKDHRLFSFTEGLRQRLQESQRIAEIEAAESFLRRGVRTLDRPYSAPHSLTKYARRVTNLIGRRLHLNAVFHRGARWVS